VVIGVASGVVVWLGDGVPVDEDSFDGSVGPAEEGDSWVQLDQLKKETLEAKALVTELQKSQESWLQRESRQAMDRSLQSLRPREQE